MEGFLRKAQPLARLRDDLRSGTVCEGFMRVGAELVTSDRCIPNGSTGGSDFNGEGAGGEVASLGNPIFHFISPLTAPSLSSRASASARARDPARLGQEQWSRPPTLQYELPRSTCGVLRFGRFAPSA